jgi:tryptophanyl-tRNA synthetase
MRMKKKLMICVVDLHSLTTIKNYPSPPDFRKQIRDMATYLIACGIDPKQTILFNQSKVRQHAELNWILGCFTPLGIIHIMKYQS